MGRQSRIFLEEHQELFLHWETKQGTVPSSKFEDTIAKLTSLLQPFEIVGWHCTCLTDGEIEEIILNGMGLPDGKMLARRINAIEETGCLTRDIALLLKSRNQADKKYRASRVWFCFYPPREAGEHGIGRFFRHWGGAALYIKHEKDPITSQAISRSGTPCLVEASVTISDLARGPELNIIRRFLIDQGLFSRLVDPYEGPVVRALPIGNVRRVV